MKISSASSAQSQTTFVLEESTCLKSNRSVSQD